MVPRHRRQYLPFSSFHPDSQNGASCLKHTPCKPAAANDRKVNGDTDSQPGLLSTLRSRCLQLSLPRTLLATTTALHVTQTCRMFPSDFFFIDFVLPSHTDFRKRLQKKNVNLPPAMVAPPHVPSRLHWHSPNQHRHIQPRPRTFVHFPAGTSTFRLRNIQNICRLRFANLVTLRIPSQKLASCGSPTPLSDAQPSHH